MGARNGRWILPEMPDFHVAFRNLLHVANLRHGTDGFTSPPQEGVLRIFFALKNPTASNLWTWVRHGSQFECNIRTDFRGKWFEVAEWIQVAQWQLRWWAFVSVVLNFWMPYYHLFLSFLISFFLHFLHSFFNSLSSSILFFFFSLVPFFSFSLLCVPVQLTCMFISAPFPWFYGKTSLWCYLLYLHYFCVEADH